MIHGHDRTIDNQPSHEQPSLATNHHQPQLIHALRHFKVPGTPVLGPQSVYLGMGHMYWDALLASWRMTQDASPEHTGFLGIHHGHWGYNRTTYLIGLFPIVVSQEMTLNCTSSRMQTWPSIISVKLSDAAISVPQPRQPVPKGSTWKLVGLPPL